MTTAWPSGARCAVAFTFDFDAEEVWLAGDPEAASKPGLLSMGTYGANVGVPELLRLLDRRGIPATFFVPGRVAETHPDRVRDIVAAGHELAAHGYTHRSPTALTRDEEEDELVRTKGILEGFGGQVTGYRSPAWEFSLNTLELLAAHGFEFSSNLMDRLHPYRHPNGVVELPVQWILDDAAHFWFSPAEWVKKISTPSEVREIWEEELLGIRDLGGLCVFTMHPQVIGRPSRLRFLDGMIELVQQLGDAWVAGCGEIAASVPRPGDERNNGV
jgi:peptidoglycan/xylan/chitin deacetylase (PgdA/CDA1 family)